MAEPKRRTGGFPVNEEGLTELQVEIRQLLRDHPELSMAQIGERVGRSKQHVHQVKQRLEEMGKL